MGGLVAGAFGVLVVAAVPIGFALAIAASIAVIAEGLPLVMIPQQIVAGMDSFPMLAVPLFIFAGLLWTDPASAAVWWRWRGRSSGTSGEGSGRSSS